MNKMIYQLVVVQNGQYGVVHMYNEKEILGEFDSFDQALREAKGKYHMIEKMQGPNDKLEGNPEDFINTVIGNGYANFSDHYFIEEMMI